MDIETAKQFIGKVVYGCRSDITHHFSSKLIEIRGDVLIFELKNGKKFVNRASEIASMYEREPVV